MLREMTGKFKKPHWLSSEEYAKIGMSDSAIPISQAVMICEDCQHQWRQCEVSMGYSGISSECPMCGGKAKRGSFTEHTWAPANTLIVWSEISK